MKEYESPMGDINIDPLDDTMAARARDYGSFERQAGTIAELWTAYLDSKGFRGTLRAQDVADLMILFKVGRAANAKQYKRDTYTDIRGYAKLVEDMHAETDQ